MTKDHRTSAINGARIGLRIFAPDRRHGRATLIREPRHWQIRYRSLEPWVRMSRGMWSEWAASEPGPSTVVNQPHAAVRLAVTAACPRVSPSGLIGSALPLVNSNAATRGQ